MKIALELGWRVVEGDSVVVIEPVLFELLEAVERGGHLNFAAHATGVSYRHAWGLMRSWEERLRAPLVNLKRGSGATLTAAGRALLDARARVRLETQAALVAAADTATAGFAVALGARPRTLRIASSSSERVTELVAMLSQQSWLPQLDLTGSEGALRRYQRSEVDIAGFHLPLGELGHSVAATLLALLDDARDQVFLLELRVLGLMSRANRPVTDLADLPGSELRLINRQPGAGTRLVLDGLLGQRGIAPGAINGYRDEEYTHSAVAATVASGGADVALGTAEAAARFDLRFTPLVQERFYLCARKSAPRELLTALATMTSETLARGARTATADAQPGVKLLRRLHSAL